MEVNSSEPGWAWTMIWLIGSIFKVTGWHQASALYCLLRRHMNPCEYVLIPVQLLEVTDKLSGWHQLDHELSRLDLLYSTM